MPLVGIREGDWKYDHCELVPPLLFNRVKVCFQVPQVASQVPLQLPQRVGFTAVSRLIWAVRVQMLHESTVHQKCATKPQWDRCRLHLRALQ